MISININSELYSKKQDAFNIKFIDSGVFTAERPWSHSKVHLNSYELLFVTKGSIYLQVSDTRYELNQSDVIILPPYKTICSYMESEQGTTFHWSKFSSDNIKFLQIAESYFNLQNSHQFTELFKELLFISKAPTYPVFSADILLSLILCKLSASQCSITQKNHAILREIIEWVGENISSTTTVKDIGELFNYNNDYLSRMFKAEFGDTLKKYISSAQLQKAKTLLLTSNYSIKQVSEILEYPNVNLFIKFFKYHEKISPQKYRNINTKIA